MMSWLNIPWKNLLLRPVFLTLIIAAAFLPTLYCLSIYFKKMRHLEELRDEYAALRPKICKVLTSRNNEHTFLKLYADADHFYTEKHLESQKLLKQESEQLKFLSNYGSFAKSSSLKNRLAKLTSDTNNLRLSPTHSHTSHLIQETEEKLMSPIEMDRDDLYRILSCIEGLSFPHTTVPIGRPNLQFTRFYLKKQTGESAHNAYVIDFDLVKREPISSREK